MKLFNVTTAASPLTLSGPITGAGFYSKTGPGTLLVSNVDSDTGAASISNGTLTLQGSGSILQSSGITVGPGGALTIDDKTSANSGNRVGDAIPITLAGGTINFLGSNSPGSRFRPAKPVSRHWRECGPVHH